MGTGRYRCLSRSGSGLRRGRGRSAWLPGGRAGHELCRWRRPGSAARHAGRSVTVARGRVRPFTAHDDPLSLGPARRSQAGIESNDQARRQSPAGCQGRYIPAMGIYPRPCSTSCQSITLPDGYMRLPQPVLDSLIKAVQDPRCRAARGDRPNRLVARYSQVRDRSAAVGQHHRNIDQRPARVMRRAGLPHLPHRTRLNQPVTRPDPPAAATWHASRHPAHQPSP